MFPKRKRNAFEALNLLFCVNRYHPAPAGGAEHQAKLQAEALVARGHSVTVICAKTHGLSSGFVDGVRVIRLPRINRRPFERVSYFVLLFLFICSRGRRFDLLHVHLANLQADVVALGAAIARRPVYVKVATAGPTGDIAAFARARRYTGQIGLKGASRVQALSREIEDELLQLPIPADAIARIPNGVDLVRFSPPTAAARLAARARLGLPASAKIVLFVGRFAHHKGVPDLLRAWEVASPDAPEAVLLLVGTSDTVDSVGDIPKRANLLVRSWADPPTDYMRAADLLVQPSRADGMSNVVLEALGCGLPVVATELGATRGFLDDGRESLLVPPGDVGALAAAMTRVLQDESLRTSLASSAVETAHRYSISTVAQQIESTYRAILDA